MIQPKKCNLCGQSSFKNIYTKNTYHLWQCNHCSLVFVYPQPTDQELSEAYSYKTGYFEHTDFEEGKLNSFFEHIFKERKGGNFLDIGCGTGHVVYTAKMSGWNAEGIDLNQDAIEKARKKGLNVTFTNVDDFRGREEHYDIIHMGDLIEHVKNPEQTIKKARDLLKKGGKLIIATPNINAFFPKYSFIISKLFGIPWSHPSPPYHLFEFSCQNLPEFLQQEGFIIEKIAYSNISFNYAIGNTGLFKKFKDEYRKNKNILESLKKNNLVNSLLMVVVLGLYFPAQLISRGLKIKDEMMLVAVK